MTLLLGSNGYVGNVFARYLDDLSPGLKTYSARHPIIKEEFRKYLLENGIERVINCAAYTGSPNIAACELPDAKTECIEANAFMPLRIAEICDSLNIKFGHVSTGCVYSDPRCDVGESPTKLYNETDEPNFCFDNANSSWYSGTKALGEKLLKNTDALIWRMRLPFNSAAHPKNLLSKLILFKKLINTTNSYTDLYEFVRAAYKTFSLQTNCKIFNLTQPGYITTKEIIDILTSVMGNKIGEKQYMTLEEYKDMDPIPRANCALDSQRAIDHGISLTPIRTSVLQTALLMNISESTYNMGK
jgi:UDP-glucose 4,6-dehydratase